MNERYKTKGYYINTDFNQLAPKVMMWQNSLYEISKYVKQNIYKHDVLFDLASELEAIADQCSKLYEPLLQPFSKIQIDKYLIFIKTISSIEKVYGKRTYALIDTISEIADSRAEEAMDSDWHTECPHDYFVNDAIFKACQRHKNQSIYLFPFNKMYHNNKLKFSSTSLKGWRKKVEFIKSRSANFNYFPQSTNSYLHSFVITKSTTDTVSKTSINYDL